ncbi:MAG: hypothetical protein LBK83_07845 [Treponema sp.]|jgi:hypothetical protein|nr:hypothetical protein [Treponema sp.]
MIDPRVSKNPVGLIRMKKKDGAFLFSEKECERWIELIVERTKKLWSEEEPREGKERGEAAGSEPAVWKPTGRGKLFWVDSE